MSATLLVCLLAPFLPQPALGAQAMRQLTGFGLAYAPPAGWTLAGADGRMEAWSRPAGDGALIVYGGAYSRGDLAIADGGALLQGARVREPVTVLEPPAQRRVGGLTLWTSAVRAQGASGEAILVRILARSADNGTMLGAVTIAAPQADSAARAAAERLLGTMRAGTPAADPAATRALAGSWRWQESNMSPTGGMVSEEGWDLAADGTFVHWTSSTVTLPGAAVEPTRTRDTGRWEVMGGALVVRAADGTMTLSLRHGGREAEIAGRRYRRP